MPYDIRYGDGTLYGELDVPTAPTQPTVKVDSYGVTSNYIVFAASPYSHPDNVPFGGIRWVVTDPPVKAKDTGFVSEPLILIVSGPPGMQFKVYAQYRDENGNTGPQSLPFSACIAGHLTP